MNAEALLKHYERIADAPDAIPRLRRFIVALAVRGKLISQQEQDETAEKLLKLITSTRISMAKAGLARPAKLLNKRLCLVSIKIPEHWCWADANDLWDLENGDRSSNYPSRDQFVHNGIPFVNAGHLLNGHVSLREMNFISRETFDRLGSGKLRKGDQIYCLRGSLGKHAIYDHDFDAAIASSLVILRPIVQEVVPYLALYLDSDIAADMLLRFDNGTAQPNLSSANFRLFQIPLPPLAEQQRIVAKVEELMALCDKLETARAEREATRDRLAAASLARLNTPDPDPETFKAHASFAISTALPALTTRPDQIKQLRQTILNLAMRGKLAAQDSSDAPASQFLSDLAETISTYCTINRVRRTIPSDISEIPFAPPSGWQWTRLSELFSVITDGDHQPPPKSGEGVAFLTIGNVTSGHLDFSDCRLVSEDYFNAIPKYRVPERGDILYTVVGATFGRPCPVDTNRPFCVQRHIAILKPAAGTNQQFLLRLLSSPLIYSQAAAGTTGTAQPTIALAQLRSFLVPVPPIEEQHRIVEKVNKLMQLCDQLEASLRDGADTRRRLLDALLHEALQPRHDNVIDFAVARKTLLAAREAVACRIVERLAPTRGFGRVRAVKPLYFAETHCGAALGGQWGRADFGPFDQWIFSFESRATSAGWFSVAEQTSSEGDTRVEYKPGATLSKKAQAAAQALGDQAAEFERILTLLANLNTEESEIIATLYAAWNDLMLEGKPVSDEIVISEFREHWHVRKAIFEPARLYIWLDWMRRSSLIPKGQGPNTRHQSKLI